MQRSRCPAQYLRPKRLPLLTIEMLEQLLQQLDSDPLGKHDRLMLKATLTFGFFGFLRVSKYTQTTRGRFDPRIHPTRKDVTWYSFCDQKIEDRSNRERYYIISVGYTYRASCPVMALQGYRATLAHRASCPVMALQGYFGNCTAPPRAPLFHWSE